MVMMGKARKAPRGFHFVPTDEELVGFFLKRKVNGDPIPDGLIMDFDIYSRNPSNLPGEMFDYLHDYTMFFFTPRHPVTEGGIRAKRDAGDGYWDNYGAGSEDIMLGSSVIGHKTAYVYRTTARGGGKRTRAATSKTNWIMHEFLLPNSGSKQFQNIALCRIHRKNMGRKQAQSQEEEERVSKRSRSEHDDLFVPTDASVLSSDGSMLPASSVGASSSSSSQFCVISPSEHDHATSALQQGLAEQRIEDWTIEDVIDFLLNTED